MCFWFYQAQGPFLIVRGVCGTGLPVIGPPMGSLSSGTVRCCCWQYSLYSFGYYLLLWPWGPAMNWCGQGPNAQSKDCDQGLQQVSCRVLRIHLGQCTRVRYILWVLHILCLPSGLVRYSGLQPTPETIKLSQSRIGSPTNLALVRRNRKNKEKYNLSIFHLLGTVADSYTGRISHWGQCY